MKLVKGILLTLIISGTFSAITADAGRSMTYNEISIPSNLFSNYYEDGYYDKVDTYSHKLYTQNTSRSVAARIKSYEQTVTSWKDVVIGDWINWGTALTNVPDSYAINIKSSSSLLGASYWGTWYYDLP